MKEINAKEAIEIFAKRGLEIDDQTFEDVWKILRDIKTRGDEAVFEYSQQFDGIGLKDTLVPAQWFEDARAEVDDELVVAIKLAAIRIRRYFEHQNKEGFIAAENGEILGQIMRPIERVAAYIPGGQAPLFSSILMTVIPAQVAGVENIVLITPPNSEGKIAPEIIRTAELLGINAIYRIGGAVGIAALAYGTETIPRVDKIVGPGNKYTMAAKKLVYGDVGIESLPGPTETLIIADDWADFQHVVADLLAQAEHEGAQPVLVTTSKALIDDVKEVIHYQLQHLKDADGKNNNAESAKTSLKNGYIVLVHDLDEAIDLANIYAPEHLCLLCKEPWELLPKVKNAGGIFLGDHSLEAIGDYIAGPSHVMPTSGTARFSSSINVRDFQKIIPLVNMNKEVFDELAPAAIRMARREGLEAHARAIESRLSDD